MGHILEVRNLKKSFCKEKNTFAAVDDVSFSIESGECLGLVGESGSGKSTVAKMITRLITPENGSILLEGKNLLHFNRKEQKEFYQKIAMVFQNPQDSFDPRQTLGTGIMEPMRNQGVGKKEARERMAELLRLVELDETYGEAFPHQVSGGQCQRAAIARALAVNPCLLICDEATSALDVTVQAQIVALLKKMQREKGLTMLFICHDLALVQAICDRVLVMYQGKIIEWGTPDEVICHPQEAYTKMLIDAVF